VPERKHLRRKKEDKIETEVARGKTDNKKRLSARKESEERVQHEMIRQWEGVQKVPITSRKEKEEKTLGFTGSERGGTKPWPCRLRPQKQQQHRGAVEETKNHSQKKIGNKKPKISTPYEKTDE